MLDFQFVGYSPLQFRVLFTIDLTVGGPRVNLDSCDQIIGNKEGKRIQVNG